ncbi:MAG: 16S rRNA (guanine527-N7)-methyltransferase [Paracoccaceae bacterium]|jgi:16S rRNA (guanine527-N7)-methyltransferase
MNSLNVSRETQEKLEIYATLLQKWSPKINLVASGSLPNLWERHFLDSAQVFKRANVAEGTWFDLGSGGGFPGLVCAILAKESGSRLQFTLVESDQRKAAFLRTVSREIDVKVEVLALRIEQLPPEPVTILSARALAPLPRLLQLSKHLIGPSTVALFQKGAQHKREVSDALEAWRFDLHTEQSRTDSLGVILELRDIHHV